jgi:hypothetical protein
MLGITGIRHHMHHRRLGIFLPSTLPYAFPDAMKRALAPESVTVSVKTAILSEQDG